FFQAEDGIRDFHVTGVKTCALPIYTISFNVPGTAGQVHYLQTPPNGYPIITNNGVTIDGYSQPGASPNSNPIHAPNNARIKICRSEERRVGKENKKRERREK